MKRWLWMLVAAPALAAGDAPTLTVVVRETALKKSPQFYASTVATAKLGQRLASLASQGAWFKVASGAKTGWVHRSAVTERKYRVSASDDAVSETSADEITLAGKGFNPTVEGGYRKRRPKSNFAAVDDLAKSAVPEKDVLRFVREGGLGGAQ
ncbi:MAG: hypothetical protein HY553_01450 [Elusimicrobia bacterium]|nr:hypothetical protein [Elusimicrobiota bacterium]